MYCFVVSVGSDMYRFVVSVGSDMYCFVVSVGSDMYCFVGESGLIFSCVHGFRTALDLGYEKCSDHYHAHWLTYSKQVHVHYTLYLRIR